MAWRPSLAAAFALLLAVAVPAPAPAQTAEAKPAAGLSPYTARYQVSYRGISGGQLESSLRRGSTPGQWIFESRAYPNLLGRIAVSPDARQRSTMLVGASGVQPLTLVFDDGSDSSAKDVRVDFDWTTDRARGQAKGKSFDLAVQPGTQDSASIQPAMLFELLAGRQPTMFWILNGAKLEDFRYWSEGHTTIDTALGRLDTVVWASQHTGSKRVNKVWHAPSLGYIPVQAIQYNKGRPDVQLRLVSLQR